MLRKRSRRQQASLHKQVWVKVNAPVDKGVAALVETLSQFPYLETKESCESLPDGSVWICFLYGSYWASKWWDISDFVLGYLGPQLMERLGDRVSVAVRITESGLPQAELLIRPGAIHQTLHVLKNLIKTYRKSSCFCDKSRT
jgi:hypothetical protein